MACAYRTRGHEHSGSWYVSCWGLNLVDDSYHEGLLQEAVLFETPPDALPRTTAYNVQAWKRGPALSM